MPSSMAVSLTATLFLLAGGMLYFGRMESEFVDVI